MKKAWFCCKVKIYFCQKLKKWGAWPCSFSEQVTLKAFATLK